MAKNRLPELRLQQSPKCGRCKQLLFMGKPITLTSANIDGVLLNNDIPVVVDCWASWCGPCQQFSPVFDQAAKLLEPYWRLAKLNTEQEQQLAARFAIRSIPTLLVFKKGREVARQSGAMSLTQLQQWLSMIKD